jgi:hypothetical protein
MGENMWIIIFQHFSKGKVFSMNYHVVRLHNKIEWQNKKTDIF